MTRWIRLAKRWMGLPLAQDYTAQLVATGSCRTALDIGCGSWSPLTALRPALRTTGVDAFPEAIAAAQTRQLHDQYLVANLLTASDAELLAPNQGQPYDLVTLFDVIEHFPKRQGYAVLEQCERLTRQFVLVQTPNGFLEQGPEFGNPFQRHLSGWYETDFAGLGYRVYGITGAQCLHGYAGAFRVRFPGVLACDVLLSRLLRIHRHPRYACNLLAVKDVRGIAPTLNPKITRF